MQYRITSAYPSAPVTITADEAQADWDATDPDLREGSLEEGFRLWRSSERIRRLVAADYTPVPEGH